MGNVMTNVPTAHAILAIVRATTVVGSGHISLVMVMDVVVTAIRSVGNGHSVKAVGHLEEGNSNAPS